MAPQVFLKTLLDSTAVVSSAATAHELHEHARDIHSIDTPLRLLHAGHDIPDDHTPLDVLGIVDNSNITTLARLLGGGKKRKKKTYTKPKKIKHKHKTVKFGVLKYYKVTDGKVERLRRECPADICGAGVFMAAHADRVYCGKCALTYVHEK